jgi:hypothetical protein
MQEKTMPEPITISAKNLGGVAMPGFCPRCFWIQMHAEGIPYQIFPGIFSSIDAYGKRLVHGWFDRHQSAPPWLTGLGKVKGYRHPPHYTKFSILDEQSNVVLRGTPDGILVTQDDSHLIVDYKTAPCCNSLSRLREGSSEGARGCKIQSLSPAGRKRPPIG